MPRAVGAARVDAMLGAAHHLWKIMSGRRELPPRDPRTRTEPVLGNLDQIDSPAPPPRERDDLPSFATDEPRRARAVTPPRQSHATLTWILGVLIAAIALGGAWVWSHQNAIRNDLPRTQLNALLAHADTALAQGKLYGSPDSARDQYEAALALDPDSEHAIAGLRHVGNAALARARDDMEHGKSDDARTELEQARGLLGGGTEIVQLDAALNKVQNHGTNVDTLLDRANAALAAGNIEGKNGAAQLFHRVLTSDPDNAVARHGMDQVGDALSSRVQDQLHKGDRGGAQHTLDRLATWLPHYVKLPDLRADLAQADQNADAQLKQQLAQGEADLHAGKFTGSGDDNALAQFQSVLAVEPNNAQARAGLGQVAQALVVQANAAMDAGHPDDAKPLLDAAGKLAPKSADLAAARSHLHALASAASPPNVDQNADQTGNDTVTDNAPPTALNPVQSAKVARLVRQANAATHKGELMLPPGDSAYDLYRAALAIDGDNAQAQAGLHSLPRAARQLFARAMHDGRLDHAGDLLSTLAELSPGDPALSPMQQDLGGAWLDRARRSADQGRYDDARRALDEARRLMPGDPRIDDVDNRIGYGN